MINDQAHPQPVAAVVERRKDKQNEIDAEVKKLETMKPRVRRKTIFGDDNWEKIEAQIEVMRDDLSEDDIYERSAEEGEDAEDKWNWNIRETALHARNWMNGDDEMSPSKSWASLVS